MAAWQGQFEPRALMTYLIFLGKKYLVTIKKTPTMISSGIANCLTPSL